jgi:DNA-binding HxlR family transcriptional regulator
MLHTSPRCKPIPQEVRRKAAGLIERTVLPSSPPKVEYRLTERGLRLGPVIEAMGAYAREPVD